MTEIAILYLRFLRFMEMTHRLIDEIHKYSHLERKS